MFSIACDNGHPESSLARLQNPVHNLKQGIGRISRKSEKAEHFTTGSSSKYKWVPRAGKPPQRFKLSLFNKAYQNSLQNATLLKLGIVLDMHDLKQFQEIDLFPFYMAIKEVPNFAKIDKN